MERMKDMIEKNEGTERELFDEPNFISSIFDTLGALVVVLDTARRIVLFNRACEKTTGYSFEDVRGRNLCDLFLTSEERDRIRTHFNHIRMGRFPIEYENHWVTRDGSLRLIMWRNTAMLDEMGVVKFVVGTGIDITESRRAREEHSRLATAIEQAAESFILVDRNHVIQYVNPAFEKLTGYNREEVVNRESGLLKSDRHDKAFFDTVWAAAKRGSVWTGRVFNKRKDGTLVETETTISPVRDPSGGIQDYVIIKRDVSEVAGLERQLRQAQKMEALGALAGGIAHDFNNILSPIIGYTEMVLGELRDKGPLQRKLGQVLKAAHRAKELVKQILAFSRQTEQKQRPVQVSLIVKEALKLLRASLPVSIEIRQNASLEASYSTVLADPTQVHQILMNLCTNAAHAMRKNGGILDVNLANVDFDAETAARYQNVQPGQYLKLTVRDTGHGMEQSVIQRIFDPYFTTKGSGEGTGMGLPVVYGIVQSYGGLITVHSEPGQGSAFHVFLPITKGAEAAMDERELPLRKGHGYALFVDDDKTILTMGSQMLKRLGFKVVSTSNSIEALELFRREPERFRLVLTDQTMPNLMGTELARELYRIRPDIPIILCTGFSELIDEEKAKTMGLQGFLMKPIVASQLSRVIQKALNRK